MAKQTLLSDMPEHQRLSPAEQKSLLRRIMTVYAAHRHPQRGEKVAKVIDQIKQELKSGHRVH
jgi:hypothetical protein